MVCFHTHADDALLRFAVICARYRGQWLLVRHRERRTWECPGGHREPGEAIDDAARRELWEETDALRFRLHPVCAYSVATPDAETYGMLYWAEIEELGALPDFEIAEVRLFEHLPDQWTYPEIQPHLMEKVKNMLETKGADSDEDL